MEKKGNRNATTVRGSLTDTKKDANKQWPRSGRRREPAAGTLSSKPESSRKPQPQRVKALDKRPRQRGNYYAGAVARIEATSLEDDHQAELGSVFLPGSKKQSLNHLLNFSYTPRESFKSSNKSSSTSISKKYNYNKEHFLQANCQFIVNNAGDYRRYLNDPDALVDWNYIEQVNVQVSEFPSCPICLYPPVAAKMTRCGHIYCWSCLLHYLSLSDKPERKCPICYENVQIRDLKSVITIPYSTFSVTETITFKLMKRPRGSLVTYPADVEIKNENILFNMSEEKVRAVYSKLLLAKTQDILSIIKREYNELLEQIQTEEDCPEKCFIEQAFQLLKEREDMILGNEVGDKAKCLTHAFGELEVCSNTEDVLGEMNTSNASSKCHYFYQASDGQNLYLHGLNAKMLEHTYGSLEFGPKTITGKILEKEGCSMTEELRKRLRYLQHLPVTCQFEVAEIHLAEPTVRKETLEHFQEQIELRKKRRQKRVKEERRREKRIEAEENLKLGKYPTPILELESDIQFPECGASDLRLRTESESSLPSEQYASRDSFITHSGPSFAKMLAKEKKETPVWPQVKSTKIQETGDYETVPSFNASFGDAIAQALERIEDKSETEGKKKKKSKQKLLFTTNMFYSKK